MAEDPANIAFEIDDELCYLVVRVAAAVEESFTELMASEGLTVRQFGILAQLSVDATLTAAEIARRLGVTAQSVGPQIDTLVRRGFVERGASAGRGHPIDVRLTDDGRATFGRAGRLARGEQVRLTGDIDATDHARLMRHLRGIEARAGGRPDVEDGDRAPRTGRGGGHPPDAGRA